MTIHPWFWAHVFATLAMVGLIWTIQLVHYPLMAEVRNGFVNYHDQHCARIAWLVGPLMGVEALTGLLLLYERPPGVGQIPVWVGFLLIGLIWAATAFLSVPEHSRLTRGYDARAISRLVDTNWIRTLAWSARGALVLWMASRGLALASKG